MVPSGTKLATANFLLKGDDQLDACNSMFWKLSTLYGYLGKVENFWPWNYQRQVDHRLLTKLTLKSLDGHAEGQRHCTYAIINRSLVIKALVE